MSERTLSIEYCVAWNYEPRALRARDILQAHTGLAVELIKGRGGVFEIRLGGAMLFSKKATGRFPTDEELRALQ